MNKVNVKVESNVKRCPSCTIYRPKNLFPKDRSRKDGLAVYCKSCNRFKLNAWKKNNPIKALKCTRKSTLKWRLGNPEKVKKSNRLWEAGHPARRLWVGVGDRCRRAEGYINIERRITLEDFCKLFDEQEAYLIPKPYVTHRPNSKWHYDRGNIRFMNKFEHAKLHGILQRKLTGFKDW